jgi:putative transcriptional regulator
MSDAFSQIEQGLKQAAQFAAGHTNGSLVHHVSVPETDVAAIRAATGLTQQDFARSIGVAVGTLRGWEQKRRRPDGPARVLLALIGSDPALVQQRLAG